MTHADSIQKFTLKLRLVLAFKPKARQAGPNTQQHQYTILRERMAEITREVGGRGVHPDAAGVLRSPSVR